MNCQQFAARLNDLLDERASPGADPELNSHADGCSACLGQLSAWEALVDTLDARTIPEPHVDCRDRVAGRLAARPKWPTLVAVALPLSLAAALAIFVLPTFLTEDRPVEPANPPAASSPPPFAATEDAGDVVAERDILLADQAQYAAMFRRTGEAIAGLPETVRNAPPLESMPVAGGIRPVTNSFSAAFNALRRTLPSKASESPG